MKNYLLIKYFNASLKEYILISLTAIIFLFISSTKIFGTENVFTVNNLKVKGGIDTNFSREKYLNKAFLKSFKILMNKILLTRDLKSIRNIELKKIKNLIRSFQILEESYRKNVYRANIKVTYNEDKIKDFLGQRNISFSHAENVSAIFFPVFYIDDKMQDFYKNYFYTNWTEVKIENELINFILPLEDLDDVLKITKMRDNIENLKINSLVNKYDTKNFTFALINYSKPNLDTYLKINFNGNKITKNLSYYLQSINSESELDLILKKIKLEITDIWKEQNLINILMPLSINVRFKHSKLKNLDKLRDVFSSLNLISNYALEEFNIDDSVFKINYYGNPKKLTSELSNLGYNLINNKGTWQIYLNE